jgi:hypothetical protein
MLTTVLSVLLVSFKPTLVRPVALLVMEDSPQKTELNVETVCPENTQKTILNVLSVNLGGTRPLPRSTAACGVMQVMQPTMRLALLIARLVQPELTAVIMPQVVTIVLRVLIVRFDHQSVLIVLVALMLSPSLPLHALTATQEPSVRMLLAAAMIAQLGAIATLRLMSVSYVLLALMLVMTLPHRAQTAKLEQWPHTIVQQTARIVSPVATSLSPGN